MKVKKDLDVNMDTDFWYDLTLGGYIKPEHCLVNPEDVRKVREAIKVIRDFEESLLEVYPID